MEIISWALQFTGAMAALFVTVTVGGGLTIMVVSAAINRILDLRSLLHMAACLSQVRRFLDNAPEDDHLTSCDRTMGASHPCTCGIGRLRAKINN